MANCTICYTSLGMLNRPTFGQGKLADNTEVCFPCFNKFKTANPTLALKMLTSSQAHELMNENNTNAIAEESRSLQIKEQVKALGISSFFGGKEINHLPKILLQDENIIDVVQGVYEKAMGVLVATNLRLIFLDKGFFSAKVEDFPYDKISSINYETGFVMGKITITVSGNKSIIENVTKQKVKIFADNVRVKLSNLNQEKQPQQIIVNQAVDVADQLTKLADLKAKGILTDEEFQAQKQKMLNL